MARKEDPAGSEAASLGQNQTPGGAGKSSLRTKPRVGGKEAVLKPFQALLGRTPISSRRQTQGRNRILAGGLRGRSGSASNTAGS